MKAMAKALADGAGELGLELSDDAIDRLLAYLALLQKWNRVYNLTAIRESSRMVSHHVLDSLAVLPHLQAHRIVDVGTGAGLPGIPLALANREWSVTLADSNHKKLAFVTQAIGELRIENAVIQRDRVETWHPAAGFDVVISRAFAELQDFVRLAGHLVAPGGKLVAMKGLEPFEEIGQLPPEFRVARVIRLNVPGVEGERHLVMMERSPVQSDA